MEICKILSGFDSISPSEFELNSEAISSGKLPDPSLFFTWYCEKAREIEKYTGSVEFSLKLLELALESLHSNSKIAKRFILATRHSLLRYNFYINSLASKLEQESVPTDEKTKILETLRTIDLRTFETGGGKKSQPINEPEPTSSDDFRNEASVNKVGKSFNSEDWITELGILDLILVNKFEEAFLLAQQNIFFPSVLKEEFSSSPINWLFIYCNDVAAECDNYLEYVKEDASINIVSPYQCEDFWSDVVNSYLGSDEWPYAQEQTVCLIATKCKMAQTILKPHINRSVNRIGDEETYF